MNFFGTAFFIVHFSLALLALLLNARDLVLPLIFMGVCEYVFWAKNDPRYPEKEVFRAGLFSPEILLETIFTWIFLTWLLLFSNSPLPSLVQNDGVIYFLFVAVCAPLFEEIFFREILFSAIARRSKSVFAAIAASSVLFAVVHLSFSHTTLFSIPEILRIAMPYLSAGLMFGILRWRSQSFVPSFIAHSLVNATLYIV